MARKPSLNSPLQLYVIGIKWPPETFIRRKIEGLAAKGIVVTICSTTPSSNISRSNIRHIRLFSASRKVLIQSLIALTITAIFRPRLTLNAWKISRYSGLSRSAALSLLRESAHLLRHSPHIVHFEWNSTAIKYFPLFDILSCPITISCRGSQVNITPHNPHHGTYSVDLQKTFKKAAAIHCVSDDIKQEAMKHGADQDKCYVIRPAVNPEFFLPLYSKKAKNKKFNVITTGSIIWRKGYEYALMAIRELVDRGYEVQYNIIGDGPDRQRVLFTIDDLGMTSHVKLLGGQSPTEVRDQLQKADAYLLSSLSEGISNAALEAMACGLPVVTTDCGGMREAVADGIEGFIVPVGDPMAIASALERLACDRNLGRVMGQAGRSRIEADFTLSQQAEMFSLMYHAVAKGSKS